MDDFPTDVLYLDGHAFEIAELPEGVRSNVFGHISYTDLRLSINPDHVVDVQIRTVLHEVAHILLDRRSDDLEVSCDVIARLLEELIGDNPALMLYIMGNAARRRREKDAPGPAQDADS